MTRPVFSPHAQADIAGIWDYTAKHWGKDQAERYIRLLRSAIDKLSAHPRRGRQCDEVRHGYRRYPIGSHIVFYRIVGTDIDIVRILRQSMDVDRHL